MNIDKLKLIIADDEQLICDMLKEVIQFDLLNLELVAVVNDGAELLSKADELCPDIIITDISMPKISGIEVIKRLTERGARIRFVVISGYKQFEYAYEALRYRVENYILKPVDSDELNMTLRKIAADLRKDGEQSRIQEVSNSLRYRFMTAKISQPDMSAATIQHINQMYMTAFSEGFFQAISVRLDMEDVNAFIDIDAPSPICSLFCRVAEELFKPICFDVIYSTSYEAAVCIINYSSEAVDDIAAVISEVFNRVSDIAGRFYGTRITVCASTTSTSITSLSRLRNEAFAAEWARMFIGTQRVIHYQELLTTVGESYRNTLDELLRLINKAFETYDTDALDRCIDVFFSLPTEVLRSSVAYAFINQLIAGFTHYFEEGYSEYDKEYKLRDVLRPLRFCQNAEEYSRILKTIIVGTVSWISLNVRSQAARPVKRAQSYIEEHFADRLSLEIVAGEVQLSPAYLSALFKKELGTNFSDYVTEFRIEKAKVMLKRTGMNVNEIAYKTGFADARYFSRVFKEKVGIKPSEYRKIYG